MIVLIGGVGHIGKTYMAQQLMEQTHIPYLSIDHLKMGLFRGLPDCGFTPTDNDSLLTDKLWPILKGMIETNIENNQNLIIEGCYFKPQNILEFGTEYVRHIYSFYLTFSHEYINAHFNDILRFESIIEHRDDDNSIDSKADYMQENEELIALCKQEHANCFVIQEDYTNETTAILKKVRKQIMLQR